jgi:hypothetical protein
MFRFLLALFAGLMAAKATVLRIEVQDRQNIAGRIPYERIICRAYFAIDPADARNREIMDIGKAARNAAGLVEFSADLDILKPRDPGQSNGTALFEPPNRGSRQMLGVFNRARDRDGRGDGLLQDQGYTLVWLGWQHDAPPRPGALRL